MWTLSKIIHSWSQLTLVWIKSLISPGNWGAEPSGSIEGGCGNPREHFFWKYEMSITHSSKTISEHYQWKIRIVENQVVSQKITSDKATVMARIIWVSWLYYGQVILGRFELLSPSSLAWVSPNLAFSRSFSFSSADFCCSEFPSIRIPTASASLDLSLSPLLRFLLWGLNEQWMRNNKRNLQVTWEISGF